MKTFNIKGKNSKNLWVVEVVRADGWTEEIRSFVRKSDMTKWLKENK